MKQTYIKKVKDLQESLPVIVRGRIEELVLNRKLAPGSKLPMESDLAKQLGISRHTLREALLLLEEDGFIVRQHGKGTFVRNQPAQLARSIVVGGKKLTVITNGVNIALELSKNSGITVILTGGIFRKTTLSLTGRKAAESLRDLNADIFFFPVQGISVEKGLTSASFSDLPFKRRAMTVAKEVVVTADSSKFDNVEFCTIASLSEVQKIITDSKVSNDMVKQLKNLRVELIVV